MLFICKFAYVSNYFMEYLICYFSWMVTDCVFVLWCLICFEFIFNLPEDGKDSFRNVVCFALWKMENTLINVNDKAYLKRLLKIYII
jgi:hypothetical protein